MESPKARPGAGRPHRVLGVLAVPALWMGLLGLGWLAPGHASPGPHASRPLVLILQSYQRDMAWSAKVQEGIESRLQEADGAEVLVEYMDTKRHPGEAWKRDLAGYLALRYKGIKPEVVIACDDPALGFLVAYGSGIFPGVPTVFCGVNDFSLDLLKGRKDITGIVERTEFASTLAFAHSLFPRMQRVFLAADGTESGQAMAREFRAQVSEALPSLDIVPLPSLPLSDLGPWLAKEPADGVVFSLNYLVDGDGQVHDTAEVSRVLASAGMPVFTGHDVFMGPGVLGGRCVTGEGQGRAVASLALEVLGGADPSAPPRVVADANSWIFSWPELDRLGLTRASLPEGSEVRERPLDFFTANPWAAVFVVVALICLILFSACLIVLIVLQRKARLKVEASEAKFRSLFASLAFGFAQHAMVYDAAGRAVDYRFVVVNEVFEKALGFSVSDTLGKLASEVYGSVPFLEDYAAVAQGAPGFTRDLPFHDKVYRTTAYSPKAGEFVTLFEDVTEAVRAQSLLVESEDRYRRLFDTMEQGVIYQTAEGRVASINPSAARILGLEPEDLVGRPPTDAVWEAVHPDGRPFPLEEQPAALARRSGLRQTAVLGIHSPRRGKRVWIVATAVPEEPYLGPERARLFITFTDITAQKEAEDSLAVQTAELSMKNTELERFAYTVSHDLKSPLVTIKGFLSFVQKDLEDGDSGRLAEDLGRIGQAADRMQDLLTDILHLSRLGSQTNKPLRMNAGEAVRIALENLGGAIAEKKVKIDLPSAWPEVRADKTRLVEVFQNLVENAIKYGGEEPQSLAIGFEPGEDGTRFFVRDSGIGLDSRYLTTIFGLFNKLDPRSEGTGVGLSLVQRIVELHGGRVWAESPGKGLGSTFWFSLPDRVEHGEVAP